MTNAKHQLMWTRKPYDPEDAKASRARCKARRAERERCEAAFRAVIGSMWVDERGNAGAWDFEAANSASMDELETWIALPIGGTMMFGDTEVTKRS
jgi:hypothetical protein